MTSTKQVSDNTGAGPGNTTIDQKNTCFCAVKTPEPALVHRFLELLERQNTFASYPPTRLKENQFFSIPVPQNAPAGREACQLRAQRIARAPGRFHPRIADF
jgi:hypothetical protein